MMQQSQTGKPLAKVGGTSRTGKVDPVRVAALQVRVAALVGAGALNSAPVSYHH
ncbi:hypothetical protein [Streptomyces cyaneofuscatus]|uniref:hypothetical protein n=1 Tax=Streptomyces cyaneofuscatus TaxID=66883 RepID=UPI0036ACE5E9